MSSCEHILDYHWKLSCNFFEV